MLQLRRDVGDRRALGEQQAGVRVAEVMHAVVREPRALQESAEDAGGAVLVHQRAVGLGEQPLGLAGALAQRLRPQPCQVPLERRGQVRGEIHG